MKEAIVERLAKIVGWFYALTDVLGFYVEWRRAIKSGKTTERDFRVWACKYRVPRFVKEISQRRRT
jgi:hypothetical protein